MMGWQSLLEANTNKEIGIVGDEAWDAAGVALDKLHSQLDAIYVKHFSRKITQVEFESIIEFTLPDEETYRHKENK